MDILTKLKQKCIDDSIPIIRDKTLAVIDKIINEHSYSCILELGTAYGYSAFCLSLNETVREITTVEKNEHNYGVALSFISQIKKIKLIKGDIFIYKPKQKFDLIFVDGPKSYQDIIVERYYPYLKNGGMMVIDNIFLNKFNSTNKLTKNQKKLREKVDLFHKWLVNHPKLNVKILDIDDGVAIISKSS